VVYNDSVVPCGVDLLAPSGIPLDDKVRPL